MNLKLLKSKLYEEIIDDFNKNKDVYMFYLSPIIFKLKTKDFSNYKYSLFSKIKNKELTTFKHYKLNKYLKKDYEKDLKTIIKIVFKSNYIDKNNKYALFHIKKILSRKSKLCYINLIYRLLTDINKIPGGAGLNFNFKENFNKATKKAYESVATAYHKATEYFENDDKKLENYRLYPIDTGKFEYDDVKEYLKEFNDNPEDILIYKSKVFNDINEIGITKYIKIFDINTVNIIQKYESDNYIDKEQLTKIKEEYTLDKDFAYFVDNILNYNININFKGTYFNNIDIIKMYNKYQKYIVKKIHNEILKKQNYYDNLYAAIDNKIMENYIKLVNNDDVYFNNEYITIEIYRNLILIQIENCIFMYQQRQLYKFFDDENNMVDFNIYFPEYNSEIIKLYISELYYYNIIESDKLKHKIYINNFRKMNKYFHDYIKVDDKKYKEPTEPEILIKKNRYNYVFELSEKNQYYQNVIHFKLNNSEKNQYTLYNHYLLNYTDYSNNGYNITYDDDKKRIIKVEYENQIIEIYKYDSNDNLMDEKDYYQNFIKIENFIKNENFKDVNLKDTYKELNNVQLISKLKPNKEFNYNYYNFFSKMINSYYIKKKSNNNIGNKYEIPDFEAKYIYHKIDEYNNDIIDLYNTFVKKFYKVKRYKKCCEELGKKPIISDDNIKNNIIEYNNLIINYNYNRPDLLKANLSIKLYETFDERNLDVKVPKVRTKQDRLNEITNRYTDVMRSERLIKHNYQEIQDIITLIKNYNSLLSNIENTIIDNLLSTLFDKYKPIIETTLINIKSINIDRLLNSIISHPLYLDIKKYIDEYIKRINSLIENPTDIIKKPKNITENPTDIIEKPKNITENPTDIIKKPKNITENPTDIIENPTDIIENLNYNLKIFRYIFRKIENPINIIENLNDEKNNMILHINNLIYTFFYNKKTEEDEIEKETLKKKINMIINNCFPSNDKKDDDTKIIDYIKQILRETIKIKSLIINKNKEVIENTIEYNKNILYYNYIINRFIKVRDGKHIAGGGNNNNNISQLQNDKLELLLSNIYKNIKLISS